MIDLRLLLEELEANNIPIISCNSDGEIEFAPEATVDDQTMATTIVSTHDPTGMSEAEKREVLTTLARQEAIAYYRRAMINANGSLSALNDIFNQAQTYAGQNADLTAIMLSKLAIYETANVIAVNLSTDQGKAIYLCIFEESLLLSASG